VDNRITRYILMNKPILKKKKRKWTGFWIKKQKCWI